jgi:hypothetical protein
LIREKGRRVSPPSRSRTGPAPPRRSVCAHAALWQNVDALAMQRLDALLSLEAGAMGRSKDTVIRDLLFANEVSPSGV